MKDKNLEYYMGLPYRVEIYPEAESGGYTAVLPSLPGCMTTADDFASLQKNLVDAKESWLQVALEDGDPIPEPEPPEIREYSGKFLTRVPKSVHRSLALRAEAENTSLNQLVLTLLVAGLANRDPCLTPPTQESMGHARLVSGRNSYIHDGHGNQAYISGDPEENC